MSMIFCGERIAFTRVWVLAVALMAVAGLFGCGQSKGGPASQTLEVAVVTLQAEPVALTTELAGRTVAYRVAEVRPQVSGIVLKRLFTEGSDVREGQVLYQIDPAPFQAALDNARAALARSEANLPTVRLREERFRSLLVDKAVSQQEYDDAAATLNQTEADIKYWKAMVEQAKINLGYTKVTAPISGRIGRSTVTEGALVTAHQPIALATIQQLDPIYVDVPRSTTEVLQFRRELEEKKVIRRGESLKKVRLFLEDGSLYPWTGTLQFQEVTVDQSTGSVMLRIVFPNPRWTLLPGMFVRASVETGVNPQAILCPQQAVMHNPKGEAYVYLVNDKNEVEMRTIAVERTIGDKWLVSSGLAPGERAVMEGMQRVRPGAIVKAVPFSPGSQPQQPAGAKEG